MPQRTALYESGNRQLEIPGLCELLDTVLAAKAEATDLEAAQAFPEIGHKVMLPNVRQIAGKEDT